MTLFETNQNNWDNCRGDINNGTTIGINVSVHTSQNDYGFYNRISIFNRLFYKEDLFFLLVTWSRGFFFYHMDNSNERKVEFTLYKLSQFKLVGTNTIS